MKTQQTKRTDRLKDPVTESRIREKGREQREAAERGRSVAFYAKEIAKRVLNPVRKSPKVSR